MSSDKLAKRFVAFVISEDKSAEEAEQRREREDGVARGKAGELDELFRQETAIFDAVFATLQRDLRAANKKAAISVEPVSRTMRDPETRVDSTGTQLVALSVETQKGGYSIMLLRPDTHPHLSVLCWRKGASGTIFRVNGSAVSPGAVKDPEAAEKQIDDALSAMSLEP